MIEEKLGKLRQLVEDKNAKGSLQLFNSRLFNADTTKATKMSHKFLKRKNEVMMLENFTNKIKDYIKENKKELIKAKSENEKKIFEIRL